MVTLVIHFKQILTQCYTGNYVRLFAVFVASPKDEFQQPKTLPDFESAVSKVHGLFVVDDGFT